MDYCRNVFLFLSVFFCISLSMQAQQPINLKDYQWKNRLILLFAKNEHTSTYQEQLSLFEVQQAALEDRDLLIFSFFADDNGKRGDESLLKQAEANIRKKYKVDTQEVLILIGKDGGEKMRAALPVEITRIYGLIDQMPMRRQEMKRKKH